jgi:hypothetical protein
VLSSMNRNARVVTGVAVILLVLSLVGSFVSDYSLTDVVLIYFVAGVIAVGGAAVKRVKIKEYLEEMDDSGSGGSFYSIDECREIAKDWARNNYHGRVKSEKGMSFDWTQASSDIAAVYDFTNQEWIKARYFYTQYGPKDKGTLIFIDATNGEVLSPKPVKRHDLKDEPFEHLEMYRMTRKMRGRITANPDQQNQGQVVNPGGIPASQNFFVGNPDGEGDS